MLTKTQRQGFVNPGTLFQSAETVYCANTHITHNDYPKQKSPWKGLSVIFDYRVTAISEAAS
jgi:hypothetical protein